MEGGFAVFCERGGLEHSFFETATLREFLAFGMRKLRQCQALHQGRDLEEVFADLKVENEEDEDLNPQELAGKFERLFLRAPASLRRSWRMTRLMNAKIRI